MVPRPLVDRRVRLRCSGKGSSSWWLEWSDSARSAGCERRPLPPLPPRDVVESAAMATPHEPDVHDAAPAVDDR